MYATAWASSWPKKTADFSRRYHWFSHEIGSWSKDVFERRTSTGSRLFAFLGSGFALVLRQIFSLWVKTLNKKNFSLVKVQWKEKHHTSGWRASVERLPKFHTDDVSIRTRDLDNQPRSQVLSPTCRSVLGTSLLGNVVEENFLRGTPDQSKELLYTDLGIAPLSSAEVSLCCGLYVFFFDYSAIFIGIPSGSLSGGSGEGYCTSSVWNFCARFSDVTGSSFLKPKTLFKSWILWKRPDTWRD